MLYKKSVAFFARLSGRNFLGPGMKSGITWQVSGKKINITFRCYTCRSTFLNNIFLKLRQVKFSLFLLVPMPGIGNTWFLQKGKGEKYCNIFILARDATSRPKFLRAQAFSVLSKAHQSLGNICVICDWKIDRRLKSS